MLQKLCTPGFLHFTVYSRRDPAPGELRCGLEYAGPHGPINAYYFAGYDPAALPPEQQRQLAEAAGLQFVQNGQEGFTVRLVGQDLQPLCQATLAAGEAGALFKAAGLAALPGL